MTRTGKWAIRAFALAFVVAALAPPVWGQQVAYTIQGRVLDANTHAGLAGAQVSLKGTRFGALADETGAYSVQAQVPAGQYTLVYSYIGRATEERPVPLAGERTVRVPDVLLRESAVSLEAVVVTGTATPTAKRALGNSVATVGAQTIAESPTLTIDQALEGHVAGAVITSNTGTPGGGVSIRLRGTSSIIGGAEPLYIIDGVIVDNSSDQQINFGYRSNPSNRLADLDPNDIDHIEILKGAAAAALYGSRANNGVVQIFTKHGQAGQSRVTASTKFSFGSLPTHLPFAMTPVDLNGQPVQRYNPEPLIFRNSLSNDEYVSLSGGSPQTQYFLSGDWVNQQGIMKASDYNKINVRVNLDQDVSTRLKLSLGANYIHSKNALVINGEQGVGGLLTAIVFTPTTVNLAARDPETGALLNKAYVFPNPLDVIANWKNPQDVDRFIGSFQMHANPFTGMTLVYRFGFDTYSMSTSQFIPRGSTLAPLGGATDALRNNYLLNNDLIGSYDLGVGSGLQLTTSVGMNHTYSDEHNLTGSASDLSPLTQLVIGAVQSASESRIETTTLGFFGQEQAAWKNRLFLTGAVRWDASSTFGADQRWQLYPKTSASYVVSDESFWKDSELGQLLPSFRLRAALGYAGNQPPTDLAYSRFSSYTSIINVDRLGLVPLSVAGNPNLKPERQREYEMGFDASLLSDRLALTFTYYNQLTKDLLLPKPFAPSSGYTETIANVGELTNKGIELQLTTTNVDKPHFQWKSTLIYSRNRNLVTKLYGAPYTVGYNNRVQQGYPLGVFYMSAFKRDAQGNIVRDSIGPVAADSSLIVGNPWPTWTGSLLNEFRIGSRISASFLLDGSFGQKVWNQTRRIMDIFSAGPLYDKVLKGKVTPAYRTRIQSIWEAYLEDASYVKLRDVTLDFTLDPRWFRGLGISGAQLELFGHDLYTWTNYLGYDPEVNMFGTNTVERGVDFAVYPHARTWGIGLRVTR
jgi:TonB-dependent starch-binding outer membrane protein SusC